MQIRKFRPADGIRCMRILQRAWLSALPALPRPMNSARFDDETEGEHIFVAEADDVIVGFISIWEPKSFVHHLYVDPDHQCRGIGAALLRYAERSGFAPLSLKCQTANVGALRFYTRNGFVEGDEKGEDRFGSWVCLVQRSDSSARDDNGSKNCTNESRY